MLNTGQFSLYEQEDPKQDGRSSEHRAYVLDIVYMSSSIGDSNASCLVKIDS